MSNTNATPAASLAGTNPEPCPRHGHKGCSCCIDCGCDPCAADCAYGDDAPTVEGTMKPDRDSILIEWFESEQDVRDHFERHPTSHGTPLPECSPEIAADWNRANRRRCKAVAKLTKCAESLRERLST